MENEYKYKCENCQLYTNSKSTYDKHMISGKHMNGKRSIRSDKKLLDKCPNCDYTSSTNTGMRFHILNNHSTKKDRKDNFNFYCEYCDYGSFSEPMYKKHMETKKHKLVMSLVK
jgi:hypothetical protein